MLIAAALTALLQAQTSLDCDFRVDLREAQIGQPIACELIVLHPSNTRVNVDLDSLKPDDGWIFLEDPVRLTGRGDGAAHTQTGENLSGDRTQVRWTLAALESGSHTLVAPPVMCEIDGVAQTCAESSQTVVIETALLPNEDAPRPPARPAIQAAEQEARYVSPYWLLAIPGGALLLALAVGLMRRSRPDVQPRVPTARERLDALDLERPAADFCRGLRACVRGGFDAAARVDRRGATDEEWLAQVTADTAVRERLAALLATCEAVRFGGRSLTRFALEDLRKQALELLPAQEVSA